MVEMSLVDQAPQTTENGQGQELPSIIYPPPDTRKIVDRTAAFVARNDRAFEDKVRESKRDNPQFSFLNPGDPYYAYYRYEVSRNAAILLDPNHQDSIPRPAPAPLPPQVAAALAPQPPVQPKPIPQPPPPYQFKLDLPPISAQDLDILKLTALFVARNGPQFRAGLTQREGRNYQFDFLRPGHSLFPSFNRLVEQYSAVLLPSKPTLERLNEARQDKSSTLDRVMKHVEYSLYEETQRKQAAAKEDQERMAYAAIDWHDFVIVQTLEFTETDQSLELPPPLKKEDLAGLSMAARRAATMGPGAPTADYGQQQGETQAWNEEAAVKEETQVPQADPVPVQTPAAPMKIRKDYIPKAMIPRSGSEQTQACPICGISLPVSEIDEHIRVESLDPKWKEQKAVLDKRQRDSNLVGSSADVTKHLKSLSTHRSDLFGPDEVGFSKKQEEDAQRRKQAEKEKAVYDGFSNLASNSDKSMADQISAIHQKVQNAPAPPPSFQPQPTFNQPPPFQPFNFPPPPPPQFAPPAPFFPPSNYGPPMHMDPKRFKMDDPLSQLLPEHQWIVMHPTPYNVQVAVPQDPNHPEWNLNGQVVWLENLPANTTIQQIKDRLSEMLSFPASKQKLTVHPANPNLGPQVAKNTYSLAVYNIPPNGKIELAIKERGGKK